MTPKILTFCAKYYGKYLFKEISAQDLTDVFKMCDVTKQEVETYYWSEYIWN